MENIQLINELKAGREKAYEWLFKTYYKPLVYYSMKFVGDIEIARELVQDLFVHIYEIRTKLEIHISLKSYLYRATRNRCINYINAEKVHDKYAQFVNETAKTAEDVVEENISAHEFEDALAKAIDKLPPRCKKIFKLNRFDGVSNADIADRLQLSKRTVETQITKALRVLREELQTYMVQAGAILFVLLSI